MNTMVEEKSTRKKELVIEIKAGEHLLKIRFQCRADNNISL